MKKILLLFAFVLASASMMRAADKEKNIIVAYVTSWSDEIPDPTWVTHLNYAFGHVNDTFDGVNVDNEARLMEILALKERYPNLKVLLSIGGWGSGGFSEMASDLRKRRAFAWDCRRLVWDLGLDGIDIDWEYPTSKAAGISASPEDTENYTKLMKEIKIAIGPKKILSQAVISTAEFIDLKAVDKYVDYTSIMAYDMGLPPYHNAPLYPSSHVQNISVSESVGKFIAAGVQPSKLVLGMSFYGHGTDEFPDVEKMKQAPLIEGFGFNWDSQALVPYMTNRQGKLVYSFETERSIGLKCQFAKDRKLHGVMIWSIDGDDDMSSLQQQVNNVMSGKIRLPEADRGLDFTNNAVEDQSGQVKPENGRNVSDRPIPAVSAGDIKIAE